MNLYYKKKIYVLWSICFLWSPALLNSQLKPGFDKAEYRELMYVSARSTTDSGYYNKFPLPAKFHQLYQSKSIGLDNMWDFGNRTIKLLLVFGAQRVNKLVGLQISLQGWCHQGQFEAQ
jgi:ribonucleotide reductase alpha subunit